MDEDLRRIVWVFVVLAVGVGVVALWWQWRGARIPHLVEVRVVLQAAGEAVASDRLRVLGHGAKVRAAAAVAYRRGEDGPVRWVCALSPVEIQGQPVAVEPLEAWPSSGGVLRAAWYSVEPSLFGWAGVAAGEAEKLAYANFLVMEMGRDLLAAVSLEARNDDFVGDPPEGNQLGGGVVRVKVRVGAYAQEDDLVARESLASPGAEEILAGQVAGVAVGLDLPPELSPEVARFLRLGCFTFADGVWPDGGAEWPLDLTPEELVGGGFIVTPRSFATAAVAGDPLARPWGEAAPLKAVGTTWRLRGAGEPLRWGSDVAPGDVLAGAGRYLVLNGDGDGDGLLSLGDSVLFAWGEPARIWPIGVVLEDEFETVNLLRSR